MTAKAKQKESGSLSSRDLIALGVFSLLFMVVSMLVVGITSMSVVAYCGCCAIAAIPAGIVWVYMHARVPRAGTSLIMALVFAVVIFVIGSGWPSVHGDSRDVRDHRGRDLRGRHHRLAGRTGGVQEAPRARGNRLAPFFKAT